MPASTDNITITSSNQTPFAPPNSSVAIGGTVNFLGSSGTVSTSVNGTSTTVFTQGAPPYSVPFSGYTLLSTISGAVTLTYNAPSGDERRGGGPQTGANGTINVGGGGGDPDPR